MARKMRDGARFDRKIGRNRAFPLSRRSRRSEFPRLRLRRGQLEIPSEAKQRESTDEGVADVDLPPAQPVASRSRESVVCVVPALSQSEDAKQHIVPAHVVALIGPHAPQMFDGGGSREYRPGSSRHGE